MPTSTSDLEVDARRDSDTQRTRFVTSVDMLGWANDAISDLYDLIDAAKQPHFHREANFTIVSGNTVSLTAITTGAPDTDGGSGFSVTTFISVATLALLRAHSVVGYVSGSTLAWVDAEGTFYRLVANTGSPDDNDLIIDAPDGRQWVQT